MNLLTITDEMLESAPIEESDRENLKEARHKDFINLESTISQAFIRELSFNGLVFLFEAIKVQSFKSGEVISLARSINKLNEKLDKLSLTDKEDNLLLHSGEFLNGFKAAIDELNEVYLKSLEN